MYTVLSSYVVALASMSPTPPLHGTTLGSFIIVSIAKKNLFIAVDGIPQFHNFIATVNFLKEGHSQD